MLVLSYKYTVTVVAASGNIRRRKQDFRGQRHIVRESEEMSEQLSDTSLKYIISDAQIARLARDRKAKYFVKKRRPEVAHETQEQHADVCEQISEIKDDEIKDIVM